MSQRPVSVVVCHPIRRFNGRTCVAEILKNAKRALLMGALPVRSTFFALFFLNAQTHIQLAIVISAIYWTLLLAFPHLILLEDPEASSAATVPEPERLPLHTDLAIHAAPAISLIIDFYYFEQRYSKNVSRYGALCLAAVLGTWYACWVEHCASYNGFCTSMPFLATSKIL